jgi:hypothetical protein
MLAHGFRRDMLAGLVLKGLATVTTDTMRAGTAIMKVERYGSRTTGGTRSRQIRHTTPTCHDRPRNRE